MTKALNWHLKYETSAGVNEAQESSTAALLSQTGKLGRDKSSQHCSRRGQRGEGEPQTSQERLKPSNFRSKKGIFGYNIKQA